MIKQQIEDIMRIFRLHIKLTKEQDLRDIGWFEESLVKTEITESRQWKIL
jgi:hypothetical protein